MVRTSLVGRDLQSLARHSVFCRVSSSRYLLMQRPMSYGIHSFIHSSPSRSDQEVEMGADRQTHHHQ
jgi:hypothetical protein